MKKSHLVTKERKKKKEKIDPISFNEEIRHTAGASFSAFGLISNCLESENYIDSDYRVFNEIKKGKQTEERKDSVFFFFLVVDVFVVVVSGRGVAVVAANLDNTTVAESSPTTKRAPTTTPTTKLRQQVGLLLRLARLSPWHGALVRFRSLRGRAQDALWVLAAPRQRRRRGAQPRRLLGTPRRFALRPLVAPKVQEGWAQARDASGCCGVVVWVPLPVEAFRRGEEGEGGRRGLWCRRRR